MNKPVLVHSNYYIHMEKNESIEHVLENMDENIVYKTKSPAYKSLLLIVAGVISFAVYTSNEWKPTDAFPHFLFMAGSCSIICGVLLFFFRKSYFVAADNHQKIKNNEVYFHVNERNRLVKLIENGNLKELRELKTAVSEGLRLRIVATKDGQICLSQVVAYEINDRINVTAVRKHSIDEAHFFADYFRENKR